MTHGNVSEVASVYDKAKTVFVLLCDHSASWPSVLIYRPPLFAKKCKSYAEKELLLSVYLNEYEVVTVLRDAKMCSILVSDIQKILAHRGSLL